MVRFEREKYEKGYRFHGCFESALIHKKRRRGWSCGHGRCWHPFLSRKFPPCSIIRPTDTKDVATGALQGLTASGLFSGQSKEFFAAVTKLAEAADAAQRGV
jgi:hypothetical protein